MAMSVTRLAISLAVHLASETRSGSGNPVPASRAACWMSCRAAATCRTMSATVICTLWNSTSGLPNCIRSCTYATVRSSAACPSARLMVALPIRSMENAVNSARKPPGPMNRLLSGTSTSSKTTSAEGMPRKPISRSRAPKLTPGRSASTMTAPMPLAPGASDIRA